MCDTGSVIDHSFLRPSVSCSRFHSRRRFLFAYSRKSKCCSYEANSRSSCGALSNLGEALPLSGESRTVASGGGGEGILCGLLFTGMARCLGDMATIRLESGLFVAARLFLEEVGAFFAVVVVLLLLLIERRSLKSESSSGTTPFWPGQISPLYTHYRLILEMTVEAAESYVQLGPSLCPLLPVQSWLRQALGSMSCMDVLSAYTDFRRRAAVGDWFAAMASKRRVKVPPSSSMLHRDSFNICGH